MTCRSICTRGIVITGLFTLAFSMIIIISLIIFNTNETNNIMFTLSYGTFSQDISLWNDENGKYYCFLPSQIDLYELKVKNNNDNILLNGEHLKDGLIDNINYNTEYNLSVGNKNIPLTFMRSKNVSAMYINTRSPREIENVHKNKNNNAKINLSLIDLDGKTVYQNSRYENIINGHGNSTWELEKKSYDIILDSSKALLGMPAGKRWVLLSNGYDETNLRNKLVYDFADKIGFSWTPQCEYVDVYMNGEYIGLYLLAEKVEVDINKVNLSDDGDFLLCAEQKIKNDGKTENFTTKNGREISVLFPRNTSKKESDVLQRYIQSAEDSIMDNDINSIDLTSWVNRYLIDEVFLNLDAEQASAYYYGNYLDDKEKIFAGPVWDFDLSLGNINSEWRLYGIPYWLVSDFRIWYPKLMENTEFKAAVINTYKASFRKLLIEMNETTVSDLSNKISCSAQMNNVRWKGKLPASYNSTDEAILAMQDFLKNRISFLDSIWLKSSSYHYITVKVGENLHYNIAVLHGSTINEEYLFELLKSVKCEKIQNIIGWNDETIGETYDFDEPIAEDKTIYAVLN